MPGMAAVLSRKGNQDTEMRDMWAYRKVKEKL